MKSEVYLVVDACTYSGSAALIAADGTVVRSGEVAMRGRDEERLLPLVAELLGSAVNPPVGVLCGAGPGSFTSLRIAASIAKGIAYGQNIPLYTVSSLLLLPYSAEPCLPAGRYLGVLDAMRGERYALPFAVLSDGSVREEGALVLLGSAAAVELAEAQRRAVVGPVAEATVDLHPHARGGAPFVPSLSKADPAPPDWEPVYGRMAEAEVKLRVASGGASG